jgi:hypothetical protein
MAYALQVDFNIRADQMNELEIGSSLERVLGYLRTLLPNEPGYVSTRALFSLDTPGRTHLIFQSVWQNWEDVIRHRESALAEGKVLLEFQPHVELEDLTIHTYKEIS